MPHDLVRAQDHGLLSLVAVGLLPLTLIGTATVVDSPLAAVGLSGQYPRAT